MPGIVVFRRRWMVASDDFVIPFSIAFVVRGIWLLVLGVSMVLYHGFHHQHTQSDQHLCQQTLDYFVGGYLALLFATNIMEVSVAWMSGKGSLMDTEPRNLIPSLLYVRLMLSIIEVGWLSIGIKWTFLDTKSCTVTSEIYIARAVVIFNWMFLFIVAIIIFCTFDTAGRTWFAMQQAQNEGYCVDSADGSDKYRLHIAKKYERRWKGCFRYAFCCKGDGQADENVYAFIGRTLSEYFQDLDVVPSDFASGLVLLRRHQKCQEQEELERALQERRVQDMTTDGVEVKKSSLRYQRTNNARVLNLNDKEELLLYKEIAYYMNYALAAYGWPIYMKNHVLCGCCKLGSSFRCCYGCRSSDSRLHKTVQVDDDNCCRCHFSALKRIAGLHNTDVIYVSYHNSLYKSPFYVALDHSKKAVVVTIRGTLSLQDILTDFTVEPERVPAEGGDPSWYGHKGMVRCAVFIQRKLENDGILQRAFNADPDCGTQSYRLILLGHSLGAGTAAILAFLLKPRYPDLFCYAYSPPGANLSLSAAKYARDFVISIVVGKDMIPRLSMFTLEDLRNKVMTLITRSRIPKWKILRGVACRCAFACCYGCKCVRLDGHRDEIDTEVHQIEIPDITHSNSMRFFPPGRIIHVVKTLSISRGLGRKDTMFEPVWSDLEDFQAIKISGLMWMDHMPDFVLDALNKCLPSSEQEEAILNGRDVPRGGATLDVPSPGEWYSVGRMEDTISYRSDVEEYSVQVPDYALESIGNECSVSKESISMEYPAGQGSMRGVCCKRDPPMAPLARPESAIDDSDVEDSGPTRVSNTWKDFNLTAVPQSIDSLLSPRELRTPHLRFPSRETVVHSSESSSLPSTPSALIPTLPPMGSIAPPAKPPRTFATEETRLVPIVVERAPPKPPRTYEYVKMNSFSLDWDFPYSRPQTVSPEKRSQVSLPMEVMSLRTSPLPAEVTSLRTSPLPAEVTLLCTSPFPEELTSLRTSLIPAEVTSLRTTPEVTSLRTSPGGRPIGYANTVENRSRSAACCASHSSFSYSVQDTQVTYLQDKASVTKLALTNGFRTAEGTNPLYATNVVYGKKPIYGAHVIRGAATDARSKPAVNGASSVDSLANQTTVDATSRVYCRTKNGYDIGPVYRPPLPGTYCTSDEKLSTGGALENRLQLAQKSSSLSADATTDLSSQVVTRRGRSNRNRSKRRAIYLDSDESSKLLQFTCSCSDIPDRGQPVDADKGRDLDRGF